MTTKAGHIVIGVQHIPVFHDGGFPDPKPYWVVSEPYRSKEMKLLHQLGIKDMLVGHWHNGRIFEREGIHVARCAIDGLVTVGWRIGIRDTHHHSRWKRAHRVCCPAWSEAVKHWLTILAGGRRTAPCGRRRDDSRLHLGPKAAQEKAISAVQGHKTRTSSGFGRENGDHNYFGVLIQPQRDRF